MATTYYPQSPMMRSRSVTPASARSLSARMFPRISNSLSRAHLLAPEVGQAHAYYNPARNSVCPRYSTNDWSASNVANYKTSERERGQAERLRADAWRTVKATDQRTRVRQSDVTKRLAERVADIDYWKKEIHEELRLLNLEQDNMKEHLRVLEGALAHTKKPLHISEECVLHREKRVGIDQVHDDVEKNLVKEVNIIKKCQSRMARLIEKVGIQMKMNRAAQHELIKDSKDKFHAHSIDDHAHHLKNYSAGIGYHSGVELIDNTTSIPDSWARFTQENILRSQKCRAASEKLRGDVDQALRECANDMWNRFNSANNSFNMRIQEITDARNKLQSHLSRTMQEIFDVEKSIELLRKAIHDKEMPMKVAQTRLDERSRRINVELCNDPAMKILQREVYEIRDSIRALKDRLRMTEAALSRLIKTKSTLENDITVKEMSLNIDQKQCMGLRKTFPMDPRVGPIFNMPLAY